MSITTVTLLTLLLPAQPAADSRFYDFRDGKPLPEDLKLFGPDAEAVVKPAPGGLRITLPTAGKQTRGWGIALNYTLTGDFELTATYELLTLDRPANGVGAGVALNALPTTNATKFTKIGRFIHSDGLNLIKAEVSDKENPHINQFNGVPASTLGGQLRLTRTGSTMHYQFADTAGARFQEIGAWPYGTEDLGMVRFIANNQGSPTAVDARLLDLKIVGSLIPHKTIDPQELVWPILIVGLPAAYLLIAAMMRRAKEGRRQAKPESPQQET